MQTVKTPVKTMDTSPKQGISINIQLHYMVIKFESRVYKTKELCWTKAEDSITAILNYDRKIKQIK